MDARLEKILRKINPAMPSFRNVLLRDRTTFQVGGRADVLVEPEWPLEASELFIECHQEGIPVFVLGSGANILVSDAGIRGLTLSTARLRSFEVAVDQLVFGAGWEVDQAAEKARNLGYRCLDFAAGMPSTVGGAVWMNARCYGSEVSDCFSSAWVATFQGLQTVHYKKNDWAYKVSPFQHSDCLILQAVLHVRPDDPISIRKDMEEHRRDRENKGHYRSPCAGSIFKNNHTFGKPSGVLIDEAGLKGLQVGGARISDWHGNIFVNMGGATAHDVRTLIDIAKKTIFSRTGFLLEEEVLYVGDWSTWGDSSVQIS